eukprot:1392535-Amorphochlora_amoeboformis.AAC.1
MSSKLACPMCTPDDFTKSLSGCGSNGKQTVDWVRTVPCIGDKSSSQQVGLDRGKRERVGGDRQRQGRDRRAEGTESEREHRGRRSIE